MDSRHLRLCRRHIGDVGRQLPTILVLFREIFGSISGSLKQYLHLMFIKSRLLVAVVTLSTSHHVTMFFLNLDLGHEGPSL